MFLTISILIFSTILGGLSLRLFPEGKRDIRFPLIFAGSYLLAITIIHIIPELYTMSSNPSHIGLYVLAGFFLQQILEYFSSGIEHGHVHKHKAISSSGRASIVIALIIHSLLEGTLLTHDSPFHDKHESHSLLLGIVLHKMPAAFALMILFIKSGYSKAMALTCLLIFASMSPLGALVTSKMELDLAVLANLVALVVGSFLHISTTILFEADDKQQHTVSWRKLAVIIAGLGLSMFTLH